MFSFDATMLTQFGVAKGWPIYLMFGNLSKYVQAQPGSGVMHHLAYIPSMSYQYQLCRLFSKHCYSYLNRSGTLSHPSIQSGELKWIQFLLTVVEISCMLFGQNY
jgi:hypothetical protein